MTGSQKITPHLWFDKEAKEAATFYCSVFPNSRITHASTIRGTPTPTGDCDIVSFELNGQPFMAISAGPMFKFNEAISFLIPLRDTSRNRLLLGTAFRGSTIGAVRLDQG